MQFTSEHEDIRRTVKRFVDEVINPNVDDWEASQTFPAREVLAKAGELGILGINKPVEYGGMGLDYSYQMVYAEELGNAHCGGIPMAIGVVTDMATPALARFGSDELKREFLAPTIAGERVCSIGVSEPGAGSDVANIRTTAVKDGDDYVINGTKMWITNGTQADWICLLCNTSDGSRHGNKSLIIVPMDAPGIEVAQKIHKIGMWSSDTAQLFFDNVRVPQRYLIGQEGAGFMYQMMQFQEERIFGATSILRGMEQCVEQTLDYTRQRQTFGQPLIHNQTVHFRLAELQTEIEALRALCYQTCEDYLNGKDVVKQASMAKLKAGRLAREVADSCLQYWGGMGYTWENPVSRFFRDGRLISIGGGADEIMLGIICKLMGSLPGKQK
ncbi:acyl-CoA dehydrogenase-like protein [Oceanococcus atlanticus]|uniref:Acyl-CoA dehydrogenase-like protein n=1 Tax=Oceanococcus atlanticus TaxID=1317117 RepID=A0A1Y1SD15_9GAMM|nr:acyl-CoA dehydrogenase family protein [Oceanococcus atlanticus]ORE86195.1 acyl-CoA dehydrogenase-like protein [Oceanococcus atlanticus]RZO86000.1 MAG: acyl-CoA dehydrogenase [Oceanococcus sp.]